MKSTVQYSSVKWYFSNWTKQFTLRTSTEIYYCLIALSQLRISQTLKNIKLYFILHNKNLWCKPLINHLPLEFQNYRTETIIFIFDQDNPKSNRLEWTLKKCCFRLLFSLHFLPHKGHSNLGSFWHSNCWWRTKVFLCEYVRSQTVQLKLDEIGSANATNMW